GGHLRQLELNALIFGNRLAELLAFLCVLGGVFPSAACQAAHLCANSDAALVQRFDGDLVALPSFAQQVVAGNTTILEDELAGAGGTNAQLVFFLADRETGEVLLHQKRGDATISGTRIYGGEENEETGFLGIGDPQLAAIEH